MKQGNNVIIYSKADFLEEYKSAELHLNLEKDLRGENMAKGVPKKDGSGKGRGQSGKGCDGNPRKRKGANK